jgi:hypothetical protein
VSNLCSMGRSRQHLRYNRRAINLQARMDMANPAWFIRLIFPRLLSCVRLLLALNPSICCGIE